MTNNANYNKQIMAEHIKEKLNQNGMTAKEFSEKLGFKYTTVLDWIHAKTYPRIDKIEKMANFFGVDKADLIEPHRAPKEDDEKPLTRNQKLIAYSIDPDISDEERQAIIEMVQAAKKFRRRI